MGNLIPGDGNDNWKTQLRGNDGRWINMYGPVSFDYTPSGGGPAKKGQGTFQGVTSPGRANIFVKDDPELEVGMYEVQSQYVKGVKAFIPTSGGSAKPVEANKPKKERKENLSGTEVQERKLSTVTKNLRKEGRFSVPRQTTSNFWGEESDIAKGAKEDYNLVYEGLKGADQSWAKKYPTFDDFWGRVKELSVGQTSQSPNDLADIPQEMKDINRAYAENVLNMNPDGKITFYRNATNRKGSPEDSALGYVTTNADFAYDYNSQAPNESGNGRYEIDAKPDEVFGMLGYSQLEDEFGVVVGRGVTSQPDRVRRVGDLAQPKLAPWLEKYQDGVGRSTGGTPYRHYALAGQFDLLPVDPLGDTLDEFLQKNGKTSADIKTKFDELYGEGAYEEYKASGNGLSFTNIKNMFVDAGNGKVGLDITKIEGGEGGSLAPGYYGSGSPESFKNDKLDNTLKMLSTFQELSGQPFIVHRSRTDELPAKPEEASVATEAELESIFSYRKEGYKGINKYLRDDSPDKKPSPKKDAVIADIDSLIEKQAPTTEQTIVYRGLSGPAAERLRDAAVGDVFTEPAFSSTSKDGQVMWSFAYGTKNVGAELHLTVPAGSKFVNVDDYIPESMGPFDIAREHEALFPRGMKFRIDYANSSDTQVFATILPDSTPEPEQQERSTGLFNEYSPERADEITAENTPLTDLGFDPEEEITIYRGVPEGVDSINAGDWVTTLPQLAKDYAGGDGKVVSSKVKAKDLLADPSSGEGAYTEEMVYRPKAENVEAPKRREVSSQEMKTEFFTPQTSSQLKDKVAQELLSRVLDKGITKDELSNLKLSMKKLRMNSIVNWTSENEGWDGDTGLAKWEGSKKLSEIQATIIKTHTGRATGDSYTSESGSLGKAIDGIIRIYKIDGKGVVPEYDEVNPTDPSLTYDEAVGFIKNINELIKSIYDNKKMGFHHTVVFEENVEEVKDKFSYSAIAEMVSEWAASSNDENFFSLALQDTVAGLFSLENYFPWSATEETSGKKEALIGLYGKVLSAYAEAQYEATQMELKAKGIASVELYRGMHDPKLRVALDESGYLQDSLVTLRPLSSFTYDLQIAIGFTGDGEFTEVSEEELNPNGVVISVSVPADRIFSMPFSGVGCLAESEVVVLGPNLKALVLNPEESKSW